MLNKMCVSTLRLTHSHSLWRNIALGALTEDEEQEMREYEQAVRYPHVPRMKHRGCAMPAFDEVAIDFDARPAGSINRGGEGDGRDELQPLLAPVPPPAFSEQRLRDHEGLHVKNDNTSAIVKLSGIRAALMQE